jgi:Ribose/xylose/arabinose/galactoside ABC-type transport systems, permease components
MGNTHASLERGQDMKRFFKQYGMVFTLVLLIVIASILSENFLTMSNVINVLRQVCVNGILAIGMTFVIISGAIDLSVGSTIGAVGMVIMILTPQIGMFPAIIAGILFAAVVGMLNGYSIYRGMPPFIMTLSTMTMLQGFAYVISQGQPFPGTDERYKFIGQGFIGPVPMPVILFIALVALSQFVLRKTRIGRSIYAVGGSVEVARLSGINIMKVRMAVYAVSGVMAAVASIVLTSRLFSCEPLVGNNYQSDAIAATVIGGTSMSGGEGSVLKTVTGVLIIGILSNILNLMRVSSYIQVIVKGLIIFVAVAADTWKKQR